MQIVNVCRSKTRNLESRNQKILVISVLCQFLLLFVLLLRYSEESILNRRFLQLNGRSLFSGHCVSSISPIQERKEVHSIFP